MKWNKKENTGLIKENYFDGKGEWSDDDEDDNFNIDRQSIKFGDDWENSVMILNMTSNMHLRKAMKPI